MTLESRAGVPLCTLRLCHPYVRTWRNFTPCSDPDRCVPWTGETVAQVSELICSEALQWEIAKTRVGEGNRHGPGRIEDAPAPVEAVCLILLFHDPIVHRHLCVVGSFEANSRILYTRIHDILPHLANSSGSVYVCECHDSRCLPRLVSEDEVPWVRASGDLSKQRLENSVTGYYFARHDVKNHNCNGGTRLEWQDADTREKRKQDSRH